MVNDSPSSPRFARAPAAWRTPRTEAGEVSSLVRTTALALFAINVLISVGIVRWQIASIPVRSFFALACLALLVLAAPRVVLAEVTKRAQVLWLIAGFALLGAVVTRLNNDTWALAGRQILEIHVQAVLGFVLAIAVVRLCGLRATVTIFVAAVCVSAFVALLQFVNLDFAWRLRALLGKLNLDSPLNQAFYVRRERPLGISFSPVHLGTQACLAFAAFYGWRLYERARLGLKGFDYQVIIALGVMVAVCFITGNRSPILGAVAFAAIYLLVTAPRLFWIMAPFAVVCIPGVLALMQMLAKSGVRVASTDDGSALGRAVLADYGWRLFTARPIGYGYGFYSVKYWQEFWQYMMYYDNPGQIRKFAPHNYFLNMLNIYGVGLFLLAPLMLPRKKATYAVALPFVAYVLHIVFHNDGPLVADFLFWYVIAMFVPALEMMNAHAPQAEARAAPSWRYWADRLRGAPATPRQS